MPPTEIENIKSDVPIKLNTLEELVNPQVLQFVFLHWGHEFFYYPQTGQIIQANELLKRFDFIVGHHPHTYQPTLYDENKFCSYSLGNFYIYFKKKMLQKGKILKVGMNGFTLTSVKESYCQTSFPDSKTIFVELCRDCD